MQKHLATVGAVAVAVTALPILVTAAPASAACGQAGVWTAIAVADSTKFDAHSDCGGVWGVRAAQKDDPVRGRYYKDGAWQVSTYGWTWIYTGNDSDTPKVIGNTVAGRDLKGQSYTYGQVIYYKF